VVVSADTDFSTLLALREATKPSVILLREPISQRRPEVQLAALLANLPHLIDALAEGSAVTIKEIASAFAAYPLREEVATR
jgi:predicted nuclease of predicted toxin-antitoxin system